MQSELTKEERRWVKRVQKVLNACPSDRIGFYTVGDPDIALYDKEKDVDEIYNDKDYSDFCQAVQDLEADLETLIFPSNVHSTAA